ncbi:MAG TPA: nitrilase-related carbon-nitrogen hydrolase [Tepidisphaeraceae bacterium]|jgi:predicted amidohydrolase
MQITAIQLDIRWENREANHARVRQLLNEAGVARRSLVVLPEMFDTGFSMNTAVTDPGERSSSEAFLRGMAAEHEVAVLAGVVARAEGRLLANEAVAFAPDGTELVRYRKCRPFSLGGETEHYCAGTTHATFEWAGCRIAPFICYDLRFPELFRPAANEVDLFVVVANWPTARSEHWVRLLQARAIENLAWVLGVNRTGTDPTLVHDGRSCLFDPHGREVFQADRSEQVLRAEVDPTEARRWREKFPALRDMGR